jgi:hypothetical protein
MRNKHISKSLYQFCARIRSRCGKSVNPQVISDNRDSCGAPQTPLTNDKPRSAAIVALEIGSRRAIERALFKQKTGRGLDGRDRVEDWAQAKAVLGLW